MAYFIDLATPKNTTKEAPASESVILRPGIISKLSIRFPKGCMYLAGGRFIYQSDQIFPANQEKWFVSNNETIIIEPDFVVSGVPGELALETYNLDEIYQHTIYATIDMDFEDAQLIRTDNLADLFFRDAFLRRGN